jgi:hypothetical protein
MPRKSAAAIATLEPRGRRLEPPPGLSEAEQAAFVATAARSRSLRSMGQAGFSHDRPWRIDFVRVPGGLPVARNLRLASCCQDRF